MDLLLGYPVDVENTVKMIDLVLEDYCGEAADGIADRRKATLWGYSGFYIKDRRRVWTGNNSVFNNNLSAAGNILAAVWH